MIVIDAGFVQNVMHIIYHKYHVHSYSIAIEV